MQQIVAEKDKIVAELQQIVKHFLYRHKESSQLSHKCCHILLIFVEFWWYLSKFDAIVTELLWNSVKYPIVQGISSILGIFA